MLEWCRLPDYNADYIDNDNDFDGDVDCSDENCDDDDDNNAHVDHDGWMYFKNGMLTKCIINFFLKPFNYVFHKNTWPSPFFHQPPPPPSPVINDRSLIQNRLVKPKRPHTPGRTLYAPSRIYYKSDRSSYSPYIFLFPFIILYTVDTHKE